MMDVFVSYSRQNLQKEGNMISSHFMKSLYADFYSFGRTKSATGSQMSHLQDTMKSSENRMLICGLLA